MSLKINRENFLRDGYLVLKDPFFRDLTSGIQHALKEMLLVCANKSAEHRALVQNAPNDFQSLLNHVCEQEKKLDSKLTPILYELFPKHPHLMGLLNLPQILNICRTLGLAFPVPATIPVTRIDRPKNDFYNTPWHQDSWYTIFSPNAVTMWLPILPLDTNMGLMQVIPGSHEQGIRPFRKFDEGYEPYVARDLGKLEQQAIEVMVDEDELLVFNQSLLHRSGRNLSSKCRMSLQLRFNDLDSMTKLCSTFTPVHSRMVLEEQQRLLQDWSNE